MSEQTGEPVDRADYFPLVQIQATVRISRSAMARLGDEAIAELRDRVMEGLGEYSSGVIKEVWLRANQATLRGTVQVALEVDGRLEGWLAPTVEITG